MVRRGEEWEWYRCGGRGEARERERKKEMSVDAPSSRHPLTR